MTQAPLRNNTCAVIITHNPGGSVFRLLNAIENQVDQVIIIDNASTGNILPELMEYARYRNINIIRNSRNEGIAAALNFGMEAATRAHYKWAISFDQDTTPFNNIIELLNKAYMACDKKERIGSIGANFGTGVNRSYHRVPASEVYAVRDYLITSGCLLNLEAYRDAGGFRNDFFIDNVDLEFSLRLREKGWLNLITREWGMVHSAGEPVYRKIFGYKVKSSGHDASRRYFMARNHVLLTLDYLGRFPYFIAKLNFFFIISILTLMIVEKERSSKIKSSLKGLRDGFSMKMRRR